MYNPPWVNAGFFRKRGLRFTFPRQVILNILFKEKGHLSAEDIYFRIHPIYPQIGLSTVYRTLELLRRLGVVSKFDFGDGRSRYELVNPNGNLHHYHLICVKCGRIIDYSDSIGEEDSFIEEMEKRLTKKYNFKIKSYQLRFYGICDKCQSRENQELKWTERR